jgi:hypothetical protein
MLQQELDRQLQSLRQRRDPKQEADEACNLERLRKSCNRKLNKMVREGQKLVKQREAIKAQIADEKIAYERTLRLLADIRQQFASIQA